MILLGRPQRIVTRQVKEADVYVAVVSFLLAGLSDTKTKLFPPDTDGITVTKQMVTLVSEMFGNKNASEKCAHIKSNCISDVVKCVFLGVDRHNVSRICR